MSELTNRFVAAWVSGFAVGLALCVLGAGCSSTASTASSGASGREKGATDAASAIAAGKLKLKEYPPLPYPPGHGEYLQLLRDRCGIEYEVVKLPAGVDENDFIMEVQGWNEVMKAEIKRQHGADIFGRLEAEAQAAWQSK